MIFDMFYKGKIAELLLYEILHNKLKSTPFSIKCLIILKYIIALLQVYFFLNN